ncbi:hypothetical protein [Aeromonas schubertii]|uniref:hypothetical protein n=1 Tax=Aeromonas schubertii TaxID=652 RepID=UPI001CC39D75|nr:hypothetical protein [Aeromonas schubertii]MBZ6072035.1 hypothetical protein [Aeromonas schubertii]
MFKQTALLLSLALMGMTPAYAISAKYRQQLEQSGCTQVTEAQGCDIHKSKAENAAAGFGSVATPASPYAGHWIATQSQTGATVANIRIDAKDQVWVNNKKLKAKKSDGALIVKDGYITYTIQGDRRLKGEDTWFDSDAGTRGIITAQ